MKNLKKILGWILLINFLPIIFLAIQVFIYQPVGYGVNITSNLYLQAYLLGLFISIIVGVIALLLIGIIHLLTE